MLAFQEGNTVYQDRETWFVEVILPLAINKLYTYRVPNEWKANIFVGKRVVVQFGRSKIYAAIIANISTEPPALYEAKYILDILDEQPLITAHQLNLWRWIAAYYICHLGDVMQAALPAALKLASETTISANVLEQIDQTTLNDKEFLVMEALDLAGTLKISDITKLLGQKTIFPLIKKLLDKGYIQVFETLPEGYKPKMISTIVLHDRYQHPEERAILFEQLNRAPKQQDALLAYLQLSRTQKKITRSQLDSTSGAGFGAIKALIDKGIFIEEKQAVSRLDELNKPEDATFSLNEKQQQALDEINHQFTAKDVVLLHGVTASGKTQLYIRLIQQCIAQQKTALYLLPEIALTTQIIARLRVHFGVDVGIYHSRFSDNERAEVWQKVLQNKYKVIIGARSAVFLPFQQLGLVIVDEEHENSYKQYDPAPRYQARDVAIYLAFTHQSKVLLGSATPSLESYYNAKAGKYGLVTLSERYGKALLPTMEIVPLGEITPQKKAHSSFSTRLIEEIKTAVSRKEQVILFQNRRGYTPVLLCTTCGYIPKCVRCDVSLTHHKSTGKMHCHYCGYKEESLRICPACGSTHIQNKGLGTERVEEELQALLPEIKIGRLDLDAARGKHGFERILMHFDEHRFDVLVGTQMVAKGLDFGNVSVIGIINADSLINYPDFRAYERAFSLLVQVSGRAGRREKAGKVIIQSYATSHRVLQQVIANNYEEMFATEISERKQYLYPPFHRLIQLDVKHKSQQEALAAAQRLELVLKEAFGARVLGPEAPLVSRIRNFYLFTFLLKAEKNGVNIYKFKDALQGHISAFYANKENKGAFIRVDVDPY